MKTLVDHLAQYAAYHRDRRNIVTHFIGIPMIVLAIAVLLSRPGIQLAGLTLAPATLLSLAAAIFYLRLDRRFGVAMLVLLLISLWIGAGLAAASTATWLGWAGGWGCSWSAGSSSSSATGTRGASRPSSTI
ncbi:hypothetical protein D9M71_174060 [compost metagenome]